MKLTTVPACILAFVAAFAALILQVLVHRIISAKLLNDYAFLVISLTMLGFAAAGALLSVVQGGVLDRPRAALTVASAAASATALLATVSFYATETRAAFAPHRPAFVSSFFDWAPFALFYAVPFGCLAFVLGALLSARDLDTRQVYFADLMGSALGALAVLPAIRHFGVERSLLGLALELVIAAHAIAGLRADGSEPSLELKWPERTRLNLGGSQLADALDRLEGQVRKRLGERDARDGEDGLRARIARAFSASVAARFAVLWPYGGSAEAADAVGVSSDGEMLVLAAREKVGLAELSAVMQAAAALEPQLPALTRDASPPVRVLDGARVMLAGLNLLPGVEDAATALADGPTLVRAGAIEGPFTPVARASAAAVAPRPAIYTSGPAYDQPAQQKSGSA